MEIKTKELSRLLNGILEGDGETVIKGFAKIEEAKPGDLTFISNPKYARYAATTGASAIIVGRDFAAQPGESPVLIKVEDPYVAIARLLQLVETQKSLPSGIEEPTYIASDFNIPEKCYIGAFTYIAKNCEMGENVLVYPQVYIGEGVSIGEGTVIYAGVKIYNGTKIGKRCVIHSGAVIGADGFGFAPNEGKYEKIPQTGIVVIEDDVEIGANTTIDRATFGETVVGSGTKLDNLIQIAHNVTIGKNNVIAAQAGVAGSAHLGDGNRVGGQAGFKGHIKIGDNNEFGAQSGIHRNVGDNQRLVGYPAVDVMEFARTTVYLRRLEELFKEQKNKI